MIPWNDRTRSAVCYGLIFGSPLAGLAIAVFWSFAASRSPTVADSGFGPLYRTAVAASIGSAAGIVLLPGPMPLRVVSALCTALLGSFAYSIGYVLLALVLVRMILP